MGNVVKFISPLLPALSVHTSAGRFKFAGGRLVVAEEHAELVDEWGAAHSQYRIHRDGDPIPAPARETAPAGDAAAGSLPDNLDNIKKAELIERATALGILSPDELDALTKAEIAELINNRQALGE